NLGLVPAFHMLGLGDPLRGNGLRVVQDLIAGFAFVQTIDDSLGYFHKRPPIPSYHFLERSLHPTASSKTIVSPIYGFRSNGPDHNSTASNSRNAPSSSSDAQCSVCHDHARQQSTASFL